MPPTPAPASQDDPPPATEAEIDEELVAASMPDETGTYWITPELAELWLTRNVNNRPLRKSRIKSLARDMVKDSWAYTGEAVKFSLSGKLLDGQHRLAAILESGCTVKSLVVLDLPEEAQAYMDSGAKRTGGDALHFRGEVNPLVLAATVRFAMLFQSKSLSTASRDSVTNAEIIEYLAEHPEIRRYVGLACRYRSKLDFKPSVFAYALWRLYAIDERDAQAFLAHIVEMRTLGAGDPINTLLQRFATARRHRETLSSVTELSFIFRTWNAMREGKKLKILKVPKGEWDIVEPK